MKSKQIALLVIDMQLVAFDGKITPPVSNGSQLLNTIATLIEGCRAMTIPIVFLQTCATPGQPYARDAHGWEIHPQVAPKPDEKVFHKVGPSGFENPELHEFLQEIGTNEVIVCGIWSEGCVAYTCESALESGYDVTLAANGHSTVRNTQADAAIVITEQNNRLRRKNASVLETNDILERVSS